MKTRLLLVAASFCSLAGVTTAIAGPLSPGAGPGFQQGPPRPDFPQFSDVIEGYTQVKSTEDGVRPLYHLWVNSKKQSVLAELPRDYAKRYVFMGWTISGGTSESGVQGGDLYAKWKRFGKNLALVEPNFMVRTTGDRESRAASDRVNTDRVVLNVPIVCIGRTADRSSTPASCSGPIDELLRPQDLRGTKLAVVKERRHSRTPSSRSRFPTRAVGS